MMTVDELDTITSDAIFGTAMIGVFVFLFLIGFICYIFLSIGLMKMGENLGVKNAWLAWIPIGNFYVIGEIVTSKLKGNGGKYALWAAIGMIVLSWIPVIGVIAGAALSVFTFVLYYWIYQKYSQNPVLHLILSIFITPYTAFAIFAMRNNKPSY
jgi:uncharacterized membrane protein